MGASPLRAKGHLMPIYKLTPRAEGLERPEWKLSIHRSAVQIEAASESEARERAALIFGKGHPIDGTVTLLQPWSMPALVTAEPLTAPDPELLFLPVRRTRSGPS